MIAPDFFAAVVAQVTGAAPEKAAEAAAKIATAIVERMAIVGPAIG